MRMLCFFLSIISVVYGDLESGQLVVNSPQALADLYIQNDGAIPMKPAMFGIPAYGHQAQLTGRVVYVPVDDSDGCQEINRTQLVDMPPPGSLVIMVVQRGQCTFVTKVQHAQDVGANACIIVDDKDEVGLPYMADDGNGATISIPSMLIHKQDGANIANAMARGDKVIMTMSWNVPHPDNIVEWEFWTSSYDPISAGFKTQFDEAALVLGDSAAMTPHYYFDRGGSQCAPSTPGATLPCGDRCSNSGRYCVFSLTAADAAMGLTGLTAMQENLRQICLFKHVNETAKDPALTQWWNYVENFLKQCAGKDFSKACSEKVMKSAGVNVDPKLIQNCVDQSGGSNTTSGANALLEAELRRQKELAIFSIPTILINGVFYRGSIDCPKNEVGSITSMTCGVLEEICLGFLNSSDIPACTSPPDCKLGLQKDPACNICGGKGFDACGTCAQPTDPDYNKVCEGCDGKPNSGLKEDICGVCGGPGPDACGNCFKTSDDPRRVNNTGACQPAAAKSSDSTDGATVSPGVVVVIVIVLIAVVGVAVFFYMRHRQNALKQDIDALLKQYLPMGETSDGAARL